jgi:hypothetical protein
MTAKTIAPPIDMNEEPLGLLSDKLLILVRSSRVHWFKDIRWVVI